MCKTFDKLGKIMENNGGQNTRLFYKTIKSMKSHKKVTIKQKKIKNSKLQITKKLKTIFSRIT